jgi:hypothetical protein
MTNIYGSTREPGRELHYVNFWNSNVHLVTADCQDCVSQLNNRVE